MRHTMITCAMLTMLAPAALTAQEAGSAARPTVTAASTASAHAAAQVGGQNSGHAFADAEAGARAHAAIEHAAAAGVPRELLVRKIAEGRAKGVADARIAAAVEQRAAVLTRVKTALDAGAQAEAAARSDSRGRPARGTRAELVSEAELTAAADACEKGVDLESLVRLYAGAGQDRSLAVSVLAELVAGGRAPQQALASVHMALAQGNGALLQLGTGVSAAAGAALTAGVAGNSPVPSAPAAVTGSIAGGGNIRVGGGN
jgi:hypothetical protein